MFFGVVVFFLGGGVNVNVIRDSFDLANIYHKISN